MSKIRNLLEFYRLPVEVEAYPDDFILDNNILEGAKFDFYYDKDRDEDGNPSVGLPYRQVTDYFTTTNVRYKRVRVTFDDDFNATTRSTQFDSSRRLTLETFQRNSQGAITDTIITTSNTGIGWSDMAPSTGWPTQLNISALKWVEESDNITGESGFGYMFNTSSGPRFLTLPANPVMGDTIAVVDLFASWGTNTMTLVGNGRNIMFSASNYVIDEDNVCLTLTFDGNNNWLITSSHIPYIEPDIPVVTNTHREIITSGSSAGIAGRTFLDPGIYDVYCIGAGGGGAGNALIASVGYAVDGSGGGGGECAYRQFEVTTRTEFQLSIGTGGTGGDGDMGFTGSTAATDGGDTTFGNPLTDLTAKGGKGAGPCTGGGDTDYGTRGEGGTGGVGQFKWDGEMGTFPFEYAANPSSTDRWIQGVGGASGGPFGHKPSSDIVNTDSYGVGGAGNEDNSVVATQGQDGSDGVIYIIGV